jgi:hypothetical protein
MGVSFSPIVDLTRDVQLPTQTFDCPVKDGSWIDPRSSWQVIRLFDAGGDHPFFLPLLDWRELPLDRCAAATDILSFILSIHMSCSQLACMHVCLLALCTGQLASCNKLELTYISSFNFAPSTDHPVLYKEFWYNSLCDMWESSHLSVLEIPLRTNIEGKIGRFLNRCFPTRKNDRLPLVW